MKRLAAISSFVFLSFLAHGQIQDVAVRSRTDQFLIYGVQPGLRPPEMAMRSVPLGQGQFFWFQPQQRTNESARVQLVPSLVAVSCERIKEGLLRELGETDRGGRKIQIRLNPRFSENDMSLVAGRFPHGWVYSLELPTDIEARRFTGAILEVLLLDLANRNSAQQVELPRWLLSGLISHLRASSMEALTLQPNMQLARNQVKIDPVAPLRERFKAEMPLSFDQLSWPEITDEKSEKLFQDSAQLFVFELLRLKNGRESMRRFLYELPQHKNWQFAFLAAFESDFPKLMDVEKWWALKFSGFSGRDHFQLWSTEESWDKLKFALDVPVQIHLKSDRMPVQAQITLQEAIETWDPVRQEMSLRRALQQLQIARLRVQPELVPLVDEYRRVLENYLEQRTKIGRSGQRNGEAPVNSNVLKKSTCQQLDALDDRRWKMRGMVLSSGK